MSDSRFLTRVVLKNYKSIAVCDVRLAPLTILVGANGAGKSNFLDALRFVTDALRHSLEHAVRDRGGINEVRRRSSGHPTHFGLRLEFTLPYRGQGFYSFRVGARPHGEFEVQEEECVYVGKFGKAYFKNKNGEVVDGSMPIRPAGATDRLYLVTASGLPEFRPVYDAFSHMGFFNLNPDRIRRLQSHDPGEMLERDGGNLPAILMRLGKDHPEIKKRIEEYLSKVVPGVTGVDVKPIGPLETLEFRQAMAGSKDPWRFLAENMSDGTLRALGILTAMFQTGNGNRPRVPLVGIEEPEVALHPAAAGILLDSLRDASEKTQILATSHSPDLLNNKYLSEDTILSVESVGGATRIAPMDAPGKKALRDRLYTVGELLRLNEIHPDLESIRQLERKSPNLFEGFIE